MSSDIDDNDNEQKNMETYKIMGDQMARLKLNYTNKDATDENSFLITYDDLAGKTQQNNPSLKTGGEPNNHNQGKVKFLQEIITAPPNEIEINQSPTNQANNNKSSKNSSKPNLENPMNESDKNLPIVDNNKNNPTQNYINPNSIANLNTNTNTSRDKTNLNNVNNNNLPSKNPPNNLNTIDSCSNKNINSIPISNTNSSNNYKPNNLVISNGNQTNITASPNVKPKSSQKINNYSNQPSNTNQSRQSINFNNTINNSNNQSTINNNNNANATLNSEDLDPIEIEIVNDNLENESNNSSINPFVLNTKVINKGRQYTLYEREMKNLKKKRIKLDKERNLIIQKKLNEMQDGPKINETSHNLLTNRGEYIPIHQRAAQIHSRHLTQIILHEQLKRMEKEKEEEKELEMIRSYRRKAKKYDKDKWNSFVDSCNKWNDEVKYKRKAAEIYRNNMEKKVNYKPRINAKSKRIMSKIQKGNHSVDDVFTRLYNDYDEHKERQKILEDENLPSFNPKINTYRGFKKNINRKSTNSSLDNFLVNDRDNNFFLESQLKIAGEKNKIKKDRTRKIKNPDKFVNKKSNNNNKAKNSIKNSKNNTIKNNPIKNNPIKNKKIEKPKEIRSYKPTLATNNSTIPVNTEGNTLGFSRYITTENPLNTNETNQYYIPTAANNYFSDEKGNEMADNSIQNPINNYFGGINEEDEVIPNNKNKYFDNIDKDNRIEYPAIDTYNNNYNYNKVNKNKSKSVEKNDYPKNNNTFFDNIYEDNRIEDDNNNYFYFNRPNNNIRNQYGPKYNYNTNNKYKSNFNKKYNNNNKFYNTNRKGPNKIINSQDPFYIFDGTNDNDNTNDNNNYFENDNNCVNDEYFKNLNRPVKSIDRNSGINENRDEDEEEENEDDENENENENENERNDDGNERQNWDPDKSNMNCCIGNEEMFKNEELLKELDKAQMDSKERQANNQGDKNDSLYRLNIMDATPENGRENVILTTNKYQNFFDIEGITEL